MPVADFFCARPAAWDEPCGLPENLVKIPEGATYTSFRYQETNKNS
jgi:hypothetical protein